MAQKNPRPILVLVSATLFTLLLLLTRQTARADTVITDCLTDSQLTTALASGGTITFNCPTSTIPWSSTKIINVNATIDGGNTITFDGGHGYRLFQVNSGVTLTLKNLTLINGYNPDSAGGAAVSNSGHLILDNVNIHSMTDSGFNGGGIGTTGAVDISNSLFHDNKATNGGAVFANGASAVVSITNTTFQNNVATGTNTNVNGFGGAIYVANGARVTVNASDIYSNTAPSGGGIYVSAAGSRATVQASQLRENYSSLFGAGIFNAGNVEVGYSTFSKNIGDTAGALMNYPGTLSIVETTFSNNQERAPGYGGAGISNYGGVMNLADVTFSGNTAAGGGGGIENAFKGTANLSNVTISGNTAGNVGGQGGGFHNFQATATLTNVTFFGNAAPSNTAGALYNANHADSHLYLTNVIFANSPSGGNCDFQKAPDTSDHNLSTDATCNFGAGRDSVKIKLGPLETNFGATLTHRLLPSSKAIDNGVTVNSIVTDQRGVARPQGTAFDVGAFEFEPCTGTPPKPELLSPAKGQELTTQSVTLDWAGPDCAKTFNVELRRDSKTGILVLNKTKLKVTQATPPALAKNHKYFWRVTACIKTNCATSAWSKFKVQ